MPDTDGFNYPDSGADTYGDAYPDAFAVHGDDPGPEQHDALRIIHVHKDLNRDRHEDDDSYQHEHSHSHAGYEHSHQHQHSKRNIQHHPESDHDALGEDQTA